MKLKKKFLLAIPLLVATIFGLMTSITEVNAETYDGQAILPGEYIPDVFIKKIKADGSGKYQQARFIKRSEDNAFVYCLQPFVDIDSNAVYNVARSDYETYLNMTSEQWDKISLIAYYGYGYGNHTAKKWYAITQVLIWRVAEPTSDIYFTNTLNGSRNDNLFTSEIAEIEALVKAHNTKPNFNTGSITLPLGQSITLNDSNEILSGFKVKSQNNASATINGNSITITATGIGNASIRLAKEDTKYEAPPVVYFKENSQNVFRVGSYDPIYTTIDLKVIGGRVEITKKDKDTGLVKPQGMGSLANAEYGIYKADTNELVGKITTDNNAFARSDYLPSLGRFYLKELKASEGYKLDSQKYYFTIDENNLLVKVDVFEEIITRDFEFTKVVASDKTQLMTPEPNVQFAIYDYKGDLVSVETTDSEGKIYITLPYGEYTLKQLSTPSGFEKIKDYHFEVKDLGPTVNKVFSNAEITSRIKVVKVDQDGKIITRAGIKFKIKDLSTGKYVCQTVAYPNHKTYCEFETDENGVLITPYPLNSGDYQLEEIDQRIEGYLWNSEPLKFSINENSKIESTEDFDEILEIRFTNQEVKGKLEVQKNGEKVVIKDGNFIYEEIPLPNVKFGLYDEEGNLVGEYTTDENGYLKVEDLKLGKYTLKELETVDGYVLDGKVYEFELVYKDQYTPVITKSYTLKNYLEKSDLEFTKSDLTTGEGIKDTKIEIYTEDDELVFSGVTDEEGKIVVKDLFVGKFYIIESEAATGYRLSEEKVYFEITEDGKIVKANMTNEKITSKVKLHKVDEEGKALAGVTIGVYDVDGNLLGSYVTDENGDIEVELEYGSYYFQEIATVDGYVLSDEKVYFDVTTDGEIIQKTLVNELEEIDVPDTSSNSYINIFAGIIILIGTSLIIISNRKRHKK